MGPIKVRFVRGWQFYNPGDVITPPGTLREWLIGCGYVELVGESNEEVETAMVTPAVETAALRVEPPRRKRGRPRKVRA